MHKSRTRQAEGTEEERRKNCDISGLGSLLSSSVLARLAGQVHLHLWEFVGLLLFPAGPDRQDGACIGVRFCMKFLCSCFLFFEVFLFRIFRL